MLERATSCLNSASRHTTRSSGQALRSRRALHSAFWHHGASDLNLPFWWNVIMETLAMESPQAPVKEHAATSPSRPTASSSSSSSSSSCSRTEMGILDFLYPAKTRALMDKLYEGPFGSVKAKHNQTPRLPRVRLFSSTTSQHNWKSMIQAATSSLTGTYVGHEPENRHFSDQVYEEMDDTNDGRPPNLPSDLTRNLYLVDLVNTPLDRKRRRGDLEESERRFVKFLTGAVPSSPYGDEFEKAWKMYNELNRDRLSPDTITQFLNFLSFSARREDRTRMLFFLTETNGHLSASGLSFWKTTLTALSTGELEKAVELHEDAIRAGSDGYVCSDLILAHAVRKLRWDLVFRVSNSVISSIRNVDDAEGIRQQVYDLWRIARRVPELIGALRNYLQQDDLPRPSRTYNVTNVTFYHLVSTAISQLPDTAYFNVVKFFGKLESTGLASPRLYESTLKRWVRHCTVNRGSFDVDAGTFLYHVWSRCNPTELGNLALVRLLKLICQRDCKFSSQAEAQRFLDSVAHSLPPNFPLPRPLIRQLMLHYSISGDVERVYDLNSRLVLTMDKEPTLARFIALIQVHSVHGDVPETTRAFNRLVKYFPAKSPRPWDLLLQASARSGDLVNGLGTFNDMLDAGVEVTDRTFKSLVKLCGSAGRLDVLLGLVKDKNKLFTGPFMRHLVVSHLLRGNYDMAEEIAVRLTQAKIEKPDFVRTLVWNTILNHAALRRDMETAKRAYSTMKENDVLVNSHTFAPLVKILLRFDYVERASYIVNQLMPEKGIAVGTRFYALTIRGYSDSRRYEDAINEYNLLRELGMRPSIGVRINYFYAKSMLLRTEPDRDEEILREVELVLQNPFMTSWNHIGQPIWAEKSSDYIFEMLISNYGEVGANNTVKKLFNLYTGMKMRKGADPLPRIGIQRAIMKTLLHSNQHDGVQRAWERLISFVSDFILSWDEKISQTASRIAQHANAELEKQKKANHGTENSQEEVSGSDNDEKVYSDLSSVPTNHAWSVPLRPPPISQVPLPMRHLMSRPFMLYMTSLAEQGKFDLLRHTISSILSAGFILDNRFWNEYVLHLCRSGSEKETVEAFRTCEERLVGGFRGWKDDWRMPRGPAKNGDLDDRDAVNPKYLQGDWVGNLRPENRTMGVLKRVWDVAKNMVISGKELGMSEGNIMLAKLLEQIAPRTLDAVEQWHMPMNDNFLSMRRARIREHDRQLRNINLAKLSTAEPQQQQMPHWTDESNTNRTDVENEASWWKEYLPAEETQQPFQQAVELETSDQLKKLMEESRLEVASLEPEGLETGFDPVESEMSEGEDLERIIEETQKWEDDEEVDQQGGYRANHGISSQESSAISKTPRDQDEKIEDLEALRKAAKREKANRSR